jgi:glutamate racemase
VLFRSELTGNKKIGIIGTQATITRDAFGQYIRGLDDSCEVYGQACPLFVPLVENGHIQDGEIITKLAAENYLKDLRELNLSSLILGCTHYPMIKNIIGEVIKTELIDAGACAAHKLKLEMLENNLLNSGKTGNREIYISDEGMNFSEIASSFLGFDIKSRIFKIDIEKY